MALIAAHLNTGLILVVKVQRQGYNLPPSLFPHLQSPVHNKPYGFRESKAPPKKLPTEEEVSLTKTPDRDRVSG